MIITKIIGGLGNQMFQYAAGRGVAFRNNAPLKLDTTGYKNREGITPWEYQLHLFTLQENFATDQEIRKIKVTKPNRIEKVESKLTAPVTSNRRQHHVVERHFHFDPKILKVPDNAYLEGYWQSEKYFSDLREIIQRDFTFKREPDEMNRAILHHITGCNSVSVHIRRGDYVANPIVAKVHGTCAPAYYHQSIAWLQQKIKHPNFFVFSDDIPWTRKNLHFTSPVFFIDHNQGSRDHEDLRLMSHCRHHIIANSTFSWWGAWLAPNRDKIVIAPRRWFNDQRLDSRDIIPSSWITR